MTSPTLPDGPHYPACCYSDEELEDKCNEMLDIYSGCMEDARAAVKKAREYVNGLAEAPFPLVIEVDEAVQAMKAPRAYKDLRRRLEKEEEREGTTERWYSPFWVLHDHDETMAKEAQDGE